MFICEPFSPYYTPLCLDCLDNQYLPELKMEYTGMIYVWKNNLDNHDWIGFTSYRQLKKSSFILDNKNVNSTISLLNKYDILCFLWLKFSTSISEQAEKYHKHITKNIKYLFSEIYNEPIPASYYKDSCGCFANYWIMSKDNFNNFMEWSYPKVIDIIKLSKNKKYFSLGKHTSNAGYIIERLFIIWYLKFKKTIKPLFSKAW